MGEMRITPFLSSHPQRLFETVALTYRHLQRIYIFNVSTLSTYPHLQPINIFSVLTSSTYPHLQPINIFNVSTSSTYQHLQHIHIFNASTSSTYPHLQRIHIFHGRHAMNVFIPQPTPPHPPICIQPRLFHINTSSMDAMQ